MYSTDEYIRADVMSASPYRLHLMVVDGALQQARATVSALEARDYDASHTASNRAREFVGEMISGLRADPAPELIALVKDYFLHVQKNLVFADLLQDLEAAQKAVSLLEGYRETWSKLRSMLPTQPAKTVV